MKLGVVIVTYNRLELLKECITACINQKEEFQKILIINNASTDGTKEYLENLQYSNLEIINSKKNLGGAGGFWLGINKAMELDLDYLLLIDDDAILDYNYNKAISDYIRNNDENIVAYSGTVITNNSIQFEHRRHLKNGFKCIDSTPEEYNQEYFDYNLSTFCGLYVSMKIIRKIGLPCKEFFIWFDDTEYSLRINQYGKIRNINKALLNHKTKISNLKGYTWKSYYGLRNQIVVIKKYFSKFTLIKFISSMLIWVIGRKIMRILKNDEYYENVSAIYKDAIRDGLNNNLGKNDKYIPGIEFKKRSV